MESKADRYPDVPSAAVRQVRSRLPQVPATALRTRRTELVAQVWYNMLVIARESGRPPAAPQHLVLVSNGRHFQAQEGTPDSTQRAFETLNDVP